MKTASKIFILMLISIFAITSCDDHEVEEPNLEEFIIKDVILSARLGSDMFTDVNDGSKKEKAMQDNKCLDIKQELSVDKKTLVMILKYNNCNEGGVSKNGEIRVKLDLLQNNTDKTFDVEFNGTKIRFETEKFN